ncbi:uncharacterized protein N7529_005122 [Penicillium soppii]|jgi:uncharacterized coiled-coil protein SlyX|uniref:uncharacterized protein n=1 Tax=Penicillium soppii TaxID=69789 RepID=UPI00254932FA|nr:uncharacterized protein N7529_005122 [Penicillium soppii]KAJ5872769.1 hypothetical protein N7529_005122 [Penicillium soppii]
MGNNQGLSVLARLDAMEEKMAAMEKTVKEPAEPSVSYGNQSLINGSMKRQTLNISMLEIRSPIREDVIARLNEANQAVTESGGESFNAS